MTTIEKRRSDVAFWSRKYERDKTEYAMSKLRWARLKLQEEEIKERNKSLSIK